jgi:hypothetical protein
MNDLKKRFGGDESMWSKTTSKAKTWMFGAGIGKKTNTVIYLFDWASRWSKRVHRMVWFKSNMRPILVFTKPQQYKERLPIKKIIQRVAARDMQKVFHDTASKLIAKWNEK